MQLTCSLGLIHPSENLGRHTFLSSCVALPPWRSGVHDWETPRVVEHYKKLFTVRRILRDVFRKHHECALQHRTLWRFVKFVAILWRIPFFVTDVHWSPKHYDDLLNSSRFYDVFLFFVTDVHWWILKPRTLRRFVKFVTIRPTTLRRLSRFVAIKKWKKSCYR
jgi:hypothetical protein